MMISFMTANYVARETGYAMHGWGHGDRATQEAFAPSRPIAERFDALLADVAALGFDTVDIWGGAPQPGLGDRRARRGRARRRSTRHGLRVATLRDLVGPGDVERACELALALGTSLIGGALRRARGVVPRARAARRPARRSRTIPSGRRRSCSRRSAPTRTALGATVDTGWWGTHGYDAARGDRGARRARLHVHLKDVRAARRAARDLPLGRGRRPGRAVRPRARSASATPARSPSSTSRRPSTRATTSARCASSSRSGSRECRARRRAATSPPATRESIAAEPRLAFAGATDVLPGRAAELVARHGGRAYASLDALLADDAVDVVVNLTAPPAHAAVTRAALEAGKHVHSEKPVALAHEDARSARRRSPRERGRAPELRAGDAARRGAADGVEARPRRRARRGARRLRRGELGPDRVVAPVARVALRGRAARRRRHLPAHDPHRDVRAGAARARLRRRSLQPERTRRDGVAFTLATPDFMVAVLELEAGVVVRLTATFWVGAGQAARDRVPRRRRVALPRDLGGVRLAARALDERRVVRRRCRSCASRIPASTGRGRSSISPTRSREGRPHRPAPSTLRMSSRR